MTDNELELDAELISYLDEQVSNLDEVTSLIKQAVHADHPSQRLFHLERLADIFDVPHYGLGMNN